MTHHVDGEDAGDDLLMNRLNITKDDVFRFVCQIRNLDSGCWEWLGGTDKKGYGKFWWDGQTGRAHRFAYFYWRGDIPEDLEPDHTCKFTGCVNPYHLEPVTRHENLMRGSSPVALNTRKTVCPKGHVYDELNTYKYGNERHCKTCARIGARVRYYTSRGRPVPEGYNDERRIR